MKLRFSTVLVLVMMLIAIVFVVAARTAVFSVTGNLAAPLTPGHNAPIDLVVVNPQPYPVKVRSISVSLVQVMDASGKKASKCGIANFAVKQGTHTLPLTVPAHSSVSLSGLKVPKADWPSVRMIVKSTASQNACKAVRITLAYDGRGWFWTS